ncbi:hypothetical protein [Anaerofustis sp.]|uniref:hypothetical protein n=1 Tax=Anaerofustis sp. TaxID=1872517 RepID=UPI0025BC58C5|nr:hypothetical protein [Anaerofustis sp.]
MPNRDGKGPSMNSSYCNNTGNCQRKQKRQCRRRNCKSDENNQNCKREFHCNKNEY